MKMRKISRFRLHEVEVEVEVEEGEEGKQEECQSSHVRGVLNVRKRAGIETEDVRIFCRSDFVFDFYPRKENICKVKY